LLRRFQKIVGDTKMSTESQEITKDDTAAVITEVRADEPPAKKKRGADNQITKDDYEDGDGDDDAENDDRLKPDSFKRASNEVLAKRKIVKVSRKFGASKPAEPAATAISDKSESSKPTISNPFASTNFASPSSSTKTGFGFGSSSGFGATSPNGNGSSGFGSGSSGFGNGSSGFGSGGGFAGVGTAGKSSGFGSGSTTGFVFGSKSSSNGGSKSLFGSPAASGITFSLSSKTADAGKKDANNIKTTKLPDKVDLKTGEEDEEEIHSGRCKSFEWVLEKSSGATTTSANGTDGGDGKNSPIKTNPSVQSSTQFQAAISSKKDDGDEKDTRSSCTENGAAASTAAEKHRWSELGIGPVKILRSKKYPERLRLVQRRESSKNGPATKVILNIPLWRESTCVRDRQALQYMRLKTMKEGKMCQYSLKFKENSDAGYFHHYLTDLIPSARKCFEKTE